MVKKMFLSSGRAYGFPILLILALLLSQGAKAQWAYKVPITVTNNVSQQVNGWQLAVYVNTATPVTNGHMLSTGADIRFSKDCAGTTFLPYYIDSGMNTSSTKIWVRIDSLTASANRTIYMFYGNNAASAASTLSTFNGPFSATDQVASGSAGGATNSQRGFRFTPKSDIIVSSFGKREPNGTTRYVTLFNWTTQAIIHQTQVSGPSATYSYAPLTTPIWLTKNTIYTLQLYQGSSDGYYFGTSSQINSALTYHDMRYCNSCTQNTFPTSSLSNYHYGYPDLQFYTVDTNTVSSVPTYTLGSIISSPTITLGSNPSVCQGTTSASLTYSATTGSPSTYSIVWSGAAPGAGFSNVTNAALPVSPIGLTVPIAAPANTYTGTLTVTNACGSSAGYGFSVVVSAAPAITAHPTNSTICSGANTSFTVTATNATGYQWQVSTNGGVNWNNITNGGIYTNATTATLNLTGATIAVNANQYRCIASGSCPSATSNAATLAINTAPTVTAHPANSTIPSGNNTSFSVTATGTTLTYQWQVSTNGGVNWNNITNGGIYSNATTATLNLTGATVTVNGYQYRCVVSGACAPSANSNAAVLTIASGGPAITGQPSNSAICSGANTSFTITATGATGYQWQLSTNGGLNWNNITNGGIYSNATTATLNITGATVAVNGNRYRCEVTGASPPNAISNAAILTINPALTITGHPANSSICSGTNASFGVTATGTTLSYQWQVSTNGGVNWNNVTNGGIYSNATTATLNITGAPFAANGNQYRCLVSDVCTSNVNSNAAVLTVALSATVSAHPVSTTNCAGSNTSYSFAYNSASPVTFQWQVSYNNGTTWNNLVNNVNYSGVTATTLNVLNVQPWMSGNVFRCELNTGCVPPVTTNNASLTVQVQPTITVNPDNVTKCVGQNTLFFVNATGSALTFQWEVSTNGGATWSNVTNGGNYAGATTTTLSVTNLPATFDTYRYRCVVSGACPTAKTSNSAILTVNTPAAINTQPPAATTICSGGNASFNVGATGTAITYQWYVHNGTSYTALTNTVVYSGTTTATLNITGITAAPNARTYIYYCQVNGPCGSASSTQVYLTVNALPVVTSNPVNVTRCDSTSAVTFAVSTTGTGLTYQWQLNTGSGFSNLVNNSTYSGVNTGILLLPSVYYSMNGYQYRCVVTGTCGTVNSGTAVLTVNPLVTPSVTIGASNTDICAGASVTFTATPTNGGAATYQWRKNGVNFATGASFATTTIANGDVFTCLMTSNATCPSPKVVLSNAITMAVTQYVTPTIAITSSTGTSGCSGKPTVFRAAITNGGPTPTYQWEVNNIAVGTNVDTYLTTLLKTGDQVRCKLTGSTKCFTPAVVTSNTITMTILPTTTSSIVIAANPDSVICEKTEVTMHSFFTNGGTTPAFQWMLNGNDIPGATGGTYKIKTLSNGDIINCRFISSAVCVFPEISQPISFDVSNLLDPSVNVSVSFLGNNEYMFTAIPVNGGNNPTYQWYRNFIIIAGATGNTYTTSNLGPTDRIYVEMASSEPCINPMLDLVPSRIVTTGVGNIGEIFKELGLYPNPNTGQFTISGELNQPVANKDVVVKITNSLGQVVYNQTYTAGGGNIKLPVTLAESVANGIYTVNIVIDDQSTNMRFMLNR